jgi:hypothetical protein
MTVFPNRLRKITIFKYPVTIFSSLYKNTYWKETFSDKKFIHLFYATIQYKSRKIQLFNR